jgi:glutamate racemase
LRILIFDSGLGGLTVYEEIAKTRGGGDELIYAADDAAFPYGALAENALVARVVAVVGDLVAALSPDLVVVACSTASTLVLGPLRGRFPELPFVGTVPAIKPAAALSRSRLVSVLGTPGTVARDYTQALARDYAGDCEVELVGAAQLARLAEDHMKGVSVADEEIAGEIAPCFVSRRGRRTDVVVLACTHYPLLAQRLGPCATSTRRRRSRGASTNCSARRGLRRFGRPPSRRRFSPVAPRRAPRSPPHCGGSRWKRVRPPHLGSRRSRSWSRTGHRSNAPPHRGGSALARRRAGSAALAGAPA